MTSNEDPMNGGEVVPGDLINVSITNLTAALESRFTLAIDSYGRNLCILPPDPENGPVCIDPDQMEEFESAVVRPFVRSGGKSEVLPDLELDSLVSVSDHARGAEPGKLQFNDIRIIKVCDTPQAVIEIAAQIDVPLVVCKLLVSDGAARGILQVHGSPTDKDGRPTLEILEKLRAGLARMA
jgi:hypothetical protein